MQRDINRWLQMVLLVTALTAYGPKYYDALTTDSFEKLCERAEAVSYHDICVLEGQVIFRREDLERWEDKHGDWEDYKPSKSTGVSV